MDGRRLKKQTKKSFDILQMVNNSNTIVFYTGIGAKRNGYHTPTEFKKVMKKYSKGMVDAKKRNIMTIKQWAKWSGAELYKRV